MKYQFRVIKRGDVGAIVYQDDQLHTTKAGALRAATEYQKINNKDLQTFSLVYPVADTIYEEKKVREFWKGFE